MATCSGYQLNWPFGAGSTAVGVGGHRASGPEDTARRGDGNARRAKLAAQSILSIMEDANWLGQSILQWMADSPTMVADRQRNRGSANRFARRPGDDHLPALRCCWSPTGWPGRSRHQTTDEQCVETREMDNRPHGRRSRADGREAQMDPAPARGIRYPETWRCHLHLLSLSSHDVREVRSTTSVRV